MAWIALGPVSAVILKRALSVSALMGAKRLAVVPIFVWDSFAPDSVMFCEAHSLFLRMVELRREYSGICVPWKYAVVFQNMS